MMDGLALRLIGVGQGDGGGSPAALDLAVPAGTWLTLLGPAGSGKSAIVRALAGFERGVVGRLEWGRTELQAMPAYRRGFGVVLQDDQLFPHLSLAENVAYPLRRRGIGRVARRRLVGAALESVELTRADRRPAAATPGERQLAALARATVWGPKILLLDEPLSAQDASDRVSRQAMLRRLHLTLGATTVLATRVAADALALSDEVAVLREGSLVQLGAPAEIYARPATPFVAAAAGEINLLPGCVHEVDEDIGMIRLDCGPLVEGTVSGVTVAGARCLFGIRPERIALAPTSAAEMGEGATDAVLIEALHLGETVRLRLLLGAGAELLVTRPVAAGPRGAMPGQRVAVAWQAHHAMVFPV